MIKGVNHKVIEISGMKNDCFEKAVLYIRPDKSNMSDVRAELEARAALVALIPHKKTKADFNFKLSFYLAVIAVIAVVTVIGCVIFFTL